MRQLKHEWYTQHSRLLSSQTNQICTFNVHWSFVTQLVQRSVFTEPKPSFSLTFVFHLISHLKFECNQPPVSGHSPPLHLHPHRLTKRSSSPPFFLFPISSSPSKHSVQRIVSSSNLESKTLIRPSITGDQKGKGSLNTNPGTVVASEILRGESFSNEDAMTSVAEKSSESSSSSLSKFNFIRMKTDSLAGEQIIDEEEEVTALLGCITSPILMVILAFVFSSLLASTTLSICLSIKVRQLRRQLESINRTAEACAARAMIMMDMHQHPQDQDLHPLSSAMYISTNSLSCPHHKNNIIDKDTDLQNNFSNSWLSTSHHSYSLFSSFLPSCFSFIHLNLKHFFFTPKEINMA